MVASIITHTLPQCSPASVGLAQARPMANKAFFFFNKKFDTHTHIQKAL